MLSHDNAKEAALSEAVKTDISPAERRRHRMRQTILDAAERVFAADGEAGLSIRRLADEIDYSPGAIYKYFTSKQQLVDELKEAFFARILEQVDELPDNHEPFLEYARRCIETYIRTALERPHHYTAAFSGESEISTQGAPVSDMSNKKRAFAVLHNMVERGVEKGAFRVDLDTHLAAKSIWASSHGLAVLMAHMPNLAGGFFIGPEQTDDQLISTHADFTIRGMMA